MSVIINVPCPQCGKEIKIALKEVDKLRAENAELCRRISVLEYEKQNSDPFGDLFRSLRK